MEIRRVGLDDPLVKPLLTGLGAYYEELYGPNDEMAKVDATEFEPPAGMFVVVVEEGTVVAGGGFRLLPPAVCEPLPPAVCEPLPPAVCEPLPPAVCEPLPPAVCEPKVCEIKVCEIKRMWTHPDHRRRGLASAVLAELEDRARAAGYGTVRLETGPRQPGAAALYAGRGYRRIDTYGWYPQTLAFEISL